MQRRNSQTERKWQYSTQSHHHNNLRRRRQTSSLPLRPIKIFRTNHCARKHLKSNIMTPPMISTLEAIQRAIGKDRKKSVMACEWCRRRKVTLPILHPLTCAGQMYIQWHGNNMYFLCQSFLSMCSQHSSKTGIDTIPLSLGTDCRRNRKTLKLLYHRLLLHRRQTTKGLSIIGIACSCQAASPSQ